MDLQVTLYLQVAGLLLDLVLFLGLLRSSGDFYRDGTAEKPNSGGSQSEFTPKNQLTHESQEKASFADVVATTTVSPATIFRQAQEAVKAKKTSHNGKAAVIFKTREYHGVMAADSRRTIVGSFLSNRPQIDKIRSKFSELFSLEGMVKIGVFDNFNVFLDFTNEEDFNNTWFRRSVDINGMQTWLQKWTPNFKLEEDLPIAPVWVLLPKLPIHLHNWLYLKQIASVIGTPLESDVATKNKTRPSMAKGRVELDLLKPLLESIWIGDEDEDSPLKGFEQNIEYEFVPKYCKHCKKLGHSAAECRVLERIELRQR
ncbi:uncharacterized protein LOC132637239 [Lycium barbarum]|uniref:uncharacterized protein LOC132637239 n=1 Tax=Lycium barbarum TaxID=112863 RepID=UPI00293F6C56|nr:uncharacterized protein LOC132637239 [Lycium barbarum]